MSKKLRIAIAGASGFVGRQLVPLLFAKGIELVLIGRDPVALRVRYPKCPCVGYEEIADKARRIDLFLHLAALNNDSEADYAAFEAANVDLAVAAHRAARQGGIDRFVYVSSVHALDPANDTNYARSKRAAAKALSGEKDWNGKILYLPVVVGERFAGRLGFLNGLPEIVRGSVLGLLAATKPTIHVEKLADYISMCQFGWAEEDSEIVLSDGQDDNLWYHLFKRLLDFGAALVFILCFFWLLIAIATAIRIDSAGPALLLQKRVGQYGRPFTCYKFRTMDRATPEKGTHEIHSSAITRVGGVLRRTKLDELPQFFNVLCNQMSLVGPRPCLPSQSELIAERQSRSVLDLKPGITGLSQVNGIDMSDPRRLALWDAKYRAMQSFALDARILFDTVWGKGGGDRTRAVD